MNKITFASALMLLAMNGFSQQTVTIKGTVKGDSKGYDKIYIYGKETKTDSVSIVNGRFEFSFPFERPVYPTMYTEYAKKQNRGYSIFGLLVDRPGTVFIDDVDITRGLNTGKVSGMQSAIDFQSFVDQQTQISIAINKKIEEKFGDRNKVAATPVSGGMTASIPAQNTAALQPRSGTPRTVGADTAKKVAMAARMGTRAGGTAYVGSVDRKIYMQASDSMRKMMIPAYFEKFIQEHPDSYASAYALDGQGRGELEPAEIEKLYKLLSPKLKQSEAGKHVADYLVGIKSSLPGTVVKNFTLTTPEGKQLSLSDLKGKYVLIDFWASWCGPCKASFQEMKKMYAKYKSDKFEIYSISIDASKDAWLKELKNQQLPWLQTLDTKNVSASGFAVTAVPTAYLIDPQGKIVLKQVGFESDGSGAIEKKLVELFGSGVSMTK